METLDAGKVKLYITRPGEEIGENAKIFGLDPGTRVGVNLVGFLIEGGVLAPGDLKHVEEAARNLNRYVDTSKPVIISGRGPHWLYAVLVHNLHFLPVVATWEPRKKVGIVIEAPTRDYIGRGLAVDGQLVDVSLGGKGRIYTVAKTVGDKAILHLEVQGDRFVEPAEMRNMTLPEVDPSRPLVLEGLMPIWLGQRLVAEYVHKVPALLFYDPRLAGGVVVATHAPGYEVGQVVPVKKEELEEVKKARETIIIGVVGDPNSGKSVFLHLLNDALRAKGIITLTQEGDLTAPTQHWSLFSPEVRKELKKHMSPEERLRWIVKSLDTVKKAGSVDVVLVDLGGGRPDLGQRVTRENLALLRHVDGVVVVSRNDAGQIEAWLRELATYVPDLKIYGVLESRLTGIPSFDGTSGVVVGLDRKLYAEGKVPEATKKVVERVAENIIRRRAKAAEEFYQEAERLAQAQA